MRQQYLIWKTLQKEGKTHEKKELRLYENKDTTALLQMIKKLVRERERERELK